MALKDDVIATALSLKGIPEQGREHAAIIAAYNAHKPLARGYAVKLSDPWCMIFISYLYIHNAGIPALGITECGCEEYLTYARNQGMCVDSPIRGDLVFYDWDGSGRATHVGLVVSVDKDGYMEVIEGNKSDSVGIRNVNYRCPCIRAIVRPRYDADRVPASSSYVRSNVAYAASFDAKLAGRYTVTETDAGSYTVSTSVNQGAPVEGATVSGTLDDDGGHVEFINTLQVATPTGVHNSSASAVAGLLLAACFMIIITMKGRCCSVEREH